MSDSTPTSQKSVLNFLNNQRSEEDSNRNPSENSITEPSNSETSLALTVPVELISDYIKANSQEKKWRITIWVPREVVEECDNIGSRIGQTGNKIMAALIQIGLEKLAAESPEIVPEITHLRLVRAKERRRQNLLHELQETAWQLGQMEGEEHIIPIEEAARAAAEVSDLPWPPPGVTIENVDPHARKMLDCIQNFKSQGKPLITLRKAYHELHWDKDFALKIAQRLADLDRIELKRGGRKNSWILKLLELPTLEVTNQ